MDTGRLDRNTESRLATSGPLGCGACGTGDPRHGATSTMAYTPRRAEAAARTHRLSHVREYGPQEREQEVRVRTGQGRGPPPPTDQCLPRGQAFQEPRVSVVAPP